MFDVVIVPQGAEAKAVTKAISQTTAKPRIVKIPIGSQNIRATLERQKFWQAAPQKVLMLGLCGSLTDSCSIGEAVLYSSCQAIGNEQKLDLTSELNFLIQQKLALSSVAGLTSDRVIGSVWEKQQFAATYNCQTIDMENYGYGRLLQQQQIQLSIIRIVSDDLAFDLPDLNSAISPTGEIKTLKMAATLLQNPFNSWRFIKNSLQALKQLETITKQIFN